MMKLNSSAVIRGLVTSDHSRDLQDFFIFMAFVKNVEKRFTVGIFELFEL